MYPITPIDELLPQGAPEKPYWYLPQYGLKTSAMLPHLDELSGELWAYSFDFGFVPGNPQVGALGTSELSYSLAEEVLLWGITGADSDNAGFRFMLYHQRQGQQRQLFDKHQLGVNAAGSAQLPTFLKSPYLLAPGDSILCEVKSLSNNASNIQVVLFGGRIA